MSIHPFIPRRARSSHSRLSTFALAVLLSLSGPVFAQGSTTNWNLTAIGVVLVPQESNPVAPPPMPDPDRLDPGQITPGNLASVTGCDQLFMDFLANTEYLGPLIDFVNCAADGTVQFLQDTLAGTDSFRAELSSYAQDVRDYTQSDLNLLPTITTQSVYVCNIETGAERINGSRLRVKGSTRCVSTEAPLKADPDVAVSGRVRLVDFIKGNQLYTTGNRNGDGVVTVTAATNNPTPNRLLKTKYHSGIELPVPNCVGGNCQVAWVVIRNKNLNTGTTIPCHTTNAQVLGATLDCEVDSRPFNQAIAN